MEKLLSVILGLLMGILATAAHQAMWFSNIPVGIILGFVLVISILTWWADVVRRNSSVIIIGICMVIAMFAMLFFAGSSIIFPANTIAYIWVYGMPVAVLVTVSFGVKNMRSRFSAEIFQNPLQDVEQLR